MTRRKVFEKLKLGALATYKLLIGRIVKEEKDDHRPSNDKEWQM